MDKLSTGTFLEDKATQPDPNFNPTEETALILSETDVEHGLIHWKGEKFAGDQHYSATFTRVNVKDIPETFVKQRFQTPLAHGRMCDWNYYVPAEWAEKDQEEDKIQFGAPDLDWRGTPAPFDDNFPFYTKLRERVSNVLGQAQIPVREMYFERVAENRYKLAVTIGKSINEVFHTTLTFPLPLTFVESLNPAKGADTYRELERKIVTVVTAAAKSFDA